jgi:hypothetical protein
MRTGAAAKPFRPDTRPPRFQRCLFARDGVFDLGRATASRIATPHMLPSTLLNGSAPTIFWLSRLIDPPHAIVVYASQPPSPTTTQHSLPSVRYDLPGPDFHRLDTASLPGAQATQGPNDARVDKGTRAVPAGTLGVMAKRQDRERRAAAPGLLRFARNDGGRLINLSNCLN